MKSKGFIALLCCLLCVCLCGSLPTVAVVSITDAPTATETQLLAYGDANGDTFINARDALTVLRHAVTGTYIKEDFRKQRADVNGDDRIDAVDALYILQFAVGKRYVFPVENKAIQDDPSPTPPDDDPSPTPLPEKGFGDRLSAFAGKLYALCADEEDNVLSPLSAYMALAMLHSVGDDGVKAEIEAFTGLTAADLAAAGWLLQAMNREEADRGTVYCKVDLTDSIWLDEGLSPNQAALDRLRRDFACDAFQAPFAADNKAANEQIRQFIKEKTGGLIDQDFNLSNKTLFALINTLYFKDVWSTVGNELPISKRAFQRPDGPQEQDFLTGYYVEGEAAENDVCTYFYARTANGYKIKFLLPKEGYTLSHVMTADNLQAVNATRDYERTYGDGARHYTRCLFPKFKVQTDTPMKDRIQQAGYLSQTFFEFDSDLLEQLLKVSEIKHTAVVDVNETGVEGAAVTIIAAGPTSAAPDDVPWIYHDFLVDRAFGFMITDENDTVLFTGKITDPQPAA